MDVQDGKRLSVHIHYHVYSEPVWKAINTFLVFRAVCWRQDQDSNSILLYLVKECEMWDRLESFSDMFIVPLMWLIMNWELTWVDTSRYHWTIQRRNSSNFLIARWWIGVEVWKSFVLFNQDKIMFRKDFATFLLSYWQNYNGETRWI